MLFKTIEKHIIVTKKKKRNVHYVYNTIFYIYKTMAFFSLNVTEIPKNSMRIIKTFTIY